MSQREVLALMDTYLKDETVGLSATVERLASLPNLSLGKPGPLSSGFNFYRGKLPGMRPAGGGGGNVMLRPVRWLPEVSDVVSNLLRVGMAAFEIGFETFTASPDDAVDEATLVATALAQMMDGLRAYSDAQQGTVEAVQSPMDFSFGDFEGPTSYGFLARITITELSSHD